MPDQTTAALRLVADNLDKLADEAADQGRHKRAAKLQNNARYVRRAAERYHVQESAMGKFADKIHAVEQERDTAKAQVIALQTQLSQSSEAQQTLDALTAAGKVADDADVAALTDDPENAAPAPVTAPVTPVTLPVTPPVDTVTGAGGTDTTVGAAGGDQAAAPAAPTIPVTPSVA